MRISDGSSDVCSSDLRAIGSYDYVSWLALWRFQQPEGQVLNASKGKTHYPRRVILYALVGRGVSIGPIPSLPDISAPESGCASPICQDRPPPGFPSWSRSHGQRSEEHTSELQSLMRISYAVFCLKQKIHT